MADDQSRLRIGDNERDEAVAMLQEHHAVGRLDSLEFNERMEKVLSARTQADINKLFHDLPEPRPATSSQPESTYLPAQSAYGDDVSIYSDEEVEDPWYAQWWMILVAVGVTVISRGNVGFLIPMMAIWLWVIYPSLKSSRRSKLKRGGQQPQVGYSPPSFARQLNIEQRRAITAELDKDRKIHAIKLYREYTGAGLREAKDAIDAWHRQLGH